MSFVSQGSLEYPGGAFTARWLGKSAENVLPFLIKESFVFYFETTESMRLSIGVNLAQTEGSTLPSEALSMSVRRPVCVVDLGKPIMALITCVYAGHVKNNYGAHDQTNALLLHCHFCMGIH